MLIEPDIAPLPSEAAVSAVDRRLLDQLDELQLSDRLPAQCSLEPLQLDSRAVHGDERLAGPPHEFSGVDGPRGRRRRRTPPPRTARAADQQL